MNITWYNMSLSHVIATILCVTCLSGIRAQTYVVEVLVVLDEPSVLHWEREAKQANNTVEEELRSLMFEVNAVYRKLQSHGVDIAIRLVDDAVEYAHGEIIDKDDISPVNDVNSIVVLHSFQAWLTNRNLRYDVALFIAGYRFPDIAGGRAERGTVCGSGIAIVAPYYDISQVQNIAHEIGHVLGLNHDGKEDTCSGRAGFLMREIGSPLDRNAHTFSSCSAASLSRTLPSRKCLAPEDSVSITSLRFGRLVGADESCRRYNRNHASRYNYYNGNYENICRSIMCEHFLTVISDKKFISRGVPVRAPDGMLCAPDKVCFEGNCVFDTMGSHEVSEYCPFGDTPSPISRQIQTCREAARKGKCEFLNWHDVCCESCHK